MWVLTTHKQRGVWIALLVAVLAVQHAEAQTCAILSVCYVSAAVFSQERWCSRHNARWRLLVLLATRSLSTLSNRHALPFDVYCPLGSVRTLIT